MTVEPESAVPRMRSMQPDRLTIGMSLHMIVLAMVTASIWLAQILAFSEDLARVEVQEMLIILVAVTAAWIWLPYAAVFRQSHICTALLVTFFYGWAWCLGAGAVICAIVYGSALAPLDPVWFDALPMILVCLVAAFYCAACAKIWHLWLNVFPTKREGHSQGWTAFRFTMKELWMAVTMAAVILGAAAAIRPWLQRQVYL